MCPQALIDVASDVWCRPDALNYQSTPTSRLARHCRLSGWLPRHGMRIPTKEGSHRLSRGDSLTQNKSL